MIDKSELEKRIMGNTIPLVRCGIPYDDFVALFNLCQFSHPVPADVVFNSLIAGDLWAIIPAIEKKLQINLNATEIESLHTLYKRLHKAGYIAFDYIVKLNKKDIIARLREINISAGARIMVHSSLSALGYVEGGAVAVCEALMETVTESGTLMMPSFNHGAPYVEGGAGYFSCRETPTTNGIIAETFRQLNGVRRSLHPTHSFAVWGLDAGRYVEKHHRTLTFGAESPLGKLEKNGGGVLLLGVDYRANSFHHVVEMTNNVHCIGKRTEEYCMKLDDGRLVNGRSMGWRGSCIITDLGTYLEKRMRGLGKETCLPIGLSEMTFFTMKDCSDEVEYLLKNGVPEHVPCHLCTQQPRVVKHTCESDWDDEHNCLKPYSPALDY